ncbi:hypothetical protein LSTR_LSTR014919 [Laodelphax striatellus]|uniref:Uncharacterized protein n=1 Tax=Laodelphax striatellus TaxID=195883 RepID=A0A482XBZ0_LAOST|nr:hypothetical protein LSTR_LSTR014919 [Laodelphax striatellus]
MGSALFLSAVMTAFVLRDHPDREEDSKSGASLLQVLRIPEIFGTQPVLLHLNEYRIPLGHS